MQISCCFLYNKLNEYIRIVFVFLVVMTQRNLFSQFRILTLKPNANFITYYTHILYRASIQTYMYMTFFCIEFVFVAVIIM